MHVHANKKWLFVSLDYVGQTLGISLSAETVKNIVATYGAYIKHSSTTVQISREGLYQVLWALKPSVTKNKEAFFKRCQQFGYTQDELTRIGTYFDQQIYRATRKRSHENNNLPEQTPVPTPRATQQPVADANDQHTALTDGDVHSTSTSIHASDFTVFTRPILQSISTLAKLPKSEFANKIQSDYQQHISNLMSQNQKQEEVRGEFLRQYRENLLAEQKIKLLSMQQRAEQQHKLGNIRYTKEKVQCRGEILKLRKLSHDINMQLPYDMDVETVIGLGN